jgi:hypothetical protein
LKHAPIVAVDRAFSYYASSLPYIDCFGKDIAEGKGPLKKREPSLIN